MSITVSVIMPAYNHEKYVGEAIESVLNQSFRDFEFIIINDGSIDLTGEIIKNYNDPRIRYFTQENQDASNTINRGLGLAQGKYISIINSDDVYHVDRLQYLINAIEKNNADFLITGINFIDENSTIICDPAHVSVAWADNLMSIYKNTGSIELTFLEGNIAVSTSNFFFKSSVIKDIGYLTPYRYAHDYDYALRALYTYHERFLFIDDKKYLNYRVHSKNTVAEAPVEVIHQVFTILIKNYPHFLSCDPDISIAETANKSFLKYFKVILDEVTYQRRLVDNINKERDGIIMEKEQENQKLEEVIQTLLNSRSWKITAPLRWLLGRFSSQ